MAMTKADKMELARQVKRMIDLGYSRTKGVKKIHWAFAGRFKKRTIDVYWKTFAEEDEHGKED